MPNGFLLTRVRASLIGKLKSEFLIVEVATKEGVEETTVEEATVNFDKFGGACLTK
jgi:hypothetical protein